MPPGHSITTQPPNIKEKQNVSAAMVEAFTIKKPKRYTEEELVKNAQAILQEKLQKRHKVKMLSLEEATALENKFVQDTRQSEAQIAAAIKEDNQEASSSDDDDADNEEGIKPESKVSPTHPFSCDVIYYKFKCIEWQVLTQTLL